LLAARSPGVGPPLSGGIEGRVALYKHLQGGGRTVQTMAVPSAEVETRTVGPRSVAPAARR